MDALAWDDAVARLDVSDHRSRNRILRDLVRSASAAGTTANYAHPLERRRRAALAARDALAAYRLAGGTPEHLNAVAGLTALLTGDAAGVLGDRARLARARIELALEHDDVIDRDEYDARVADVEQRAAALERPPTAASDRDDHQPADGHEDAGT